MLEKSLLVPSEKGSLDGLLGEAEGKRAVVVSHPHPLYGGDMYNNVVEALVVAYREAGYATLRFNFRGISRSEESYDQAQNGQDDVAAALAYLKGLGKTAVDLAGYSFGSWINALGLERFTDVKRMIMVSPPVRLLSYDAVKPSDKIRLIVAGENDNIAPPEEIKRLLPVWNPRAELKVIAGADHFYWGKTEAIQEIVGDFLAL